MLTKFTLKVLHFAIKHKIWTDRETPQSDVCYYNSNIRDSVLKTEYSATESEYADDSGPDNTDKAISKVRN